MGATVLIVDDSQSMRQMIGFTLKENGYEILTAANGKEGCEKLQEGLKFIITDLYMPEMDGIEFIRQIRASATNKFTPVIMLTTESEKEKQDSGRQAGASAWLIKPFTPEKLMETVKKVVS
jgi:two-component system, chemotaxis family, chemotaxis protein CheY